MVKIWVEILVSQKLLDDAKQSATYALKTASKRAIQKTAEAAGDLIGSKIANQIPKVSKTSSQNKRQCTTGPTAMTVQSSKQLIKKSWHTVQSIILKKSNFGPNLTF